jgi:beta-fructofuranosidase
VTTTVYVDDRGEALAAGAADAPAFNAYSGSIVRDGDGIHHLFYTGQNPQQLGAKTVCVPLVVLKGTLISSCSATSPTG